MPAVFVDTNILVYAHDAETPGKQAAAARQLKILWESGSGRLSVQVLQEFYVSATRKLGSPLARAAAREVVSTYAAWVHASSTPKTVLRACELAELARLSFWDAMIVAAAEDVHADEIWSEDFNAGQTIGGIRIVNPLL